LNCEIWHLEYIKTERGAGYMFEVPVEVLR